MEMGRAEIEMGEVVQLPGETLSEGCVKRRSVKSRRGRKEEAHGRARENDTNCRN